MNQKTFDKRIKALFRQGKKYLKQKKAMITQATENFRKENPHLGSVYVEHFKKTCEKVWDRDKKKILKKEFDKSVDRVKDRMRRITTRH